MNLVYKITPEQIAQKTHLTATIGIMVIVVALILLLILSICRIFNIGPRIEIILAICWGLSAICVLTYIDAKAKSIQPQPVSLLEIRDKLVIEKDKLTIQPLGDDYTYGDRLVPKSDSLFKQTVDENGKLKRDQTNTFKIVVDDFFPEKTPQLVDKDGNTYEISKLDLDKLRNAKQND